MFISGNWWKKEFPQKFLSGRALCSLKVAVSLSLMLPYLGSPFSFNLFLRFLPKLLRPWRVRLLTSKGEKQPIRVESPCLWVKVAFVSGNFKKWNLAFLAKWSWKFMMETNALWRKAIVSKYSIVLSGLACLSKMVYRQETHDLTVKNAVCT